MFLDRFNCFRGLRQAPMIVTAVACSLALLACGGGSGAGSSSQGGTSPVVASAPVLSLFAGSTGGPGSLDGTGATASFYSPIGITTDNTGNVYVVDRDNSTIRKITPAGAVTTLAGTAGSLQVSTDGTGAAARFNLPQGMATDNTGNLYVADTGNHTIRKITPAGVVTTLVGTAGVIGSADGTGAAVRFNNPRGIATDSAGNLYVADTNNHTIRKITPSGAVMTLAGTTGVEGSTDGTGATASFKFPVGIATDSTGNIYVADTGNHTIRRITPAGIVTTLAGTTGIVGSSDGTGSVASFNYPQFITPDNAGNLYVADTFNYTIRKITPAGVVTTLAGTAGVFGSADGNGAAARFVNPRGIAIDSAGNFYVADTGNHTIRKITPVGMVTTLAGTAHVQGSADGPGAAASFHAPQGIATDSAGNVYVADTGNQTIRKITPAGVVTTLAGTAGVFGSADGNGAAAIFKSLVGVATDVTGNVYVTDQSSQTIRKITAAGVVTTLAGAAGIIGSADGIGAAARFRSPAGIATDSAGNVFVADSGNGTIRKITPAGAVTTFAGTAASSGSADGTGAAAKFYSPRGLAIDSADNVYVADLQNNTIRKITPAGVVTTLAGMPLVSGSADGTGAAARFDFPQGVAIDSTGNVYVADTNNHTIRKITPAGVVTTVVGMTHSPERFDAGNLPGVILPPLGVAMSGTTLYIVMGDAVVRVTNLP